jgi:hypothetical protein
VGPERVSAEPRKARSVLAPDAPKSTNHYYLTLCGLGLYNRTNLMHKFLRALLLLSFFNVGLAFAEEARVLFYIGPSRDVRSFDLELCLSFRKRYTEPFFLKPKAVLSRLKLRKSLC